MEIFAFVFLGLLVIALLKAARSSGRQADTRASAGTFFVAGRENTVNVTQHITQTTQIYSGRTAPLFSVSFGKNNQFRVPVIANNAREVEANLGRIRKSDKRLKGRDITISRMSPDELMPGEQPLQISGPR